MRKMTFLACAAMLTSAFVLGSCNKNDQNEPKAQMPEVKTQFSISLPGQLQGGPNRMPSETVQRSGNFNGMNGITLVPFAREGVVEGGDARLGTNITVAGSVPMSIGTGELGTNSKAKVFEDVSIPLTTASFLFYAKSAKTGTDFEIGALNETGLTSTNPSSFEFTPKPILTDAVFASGTKGTLLLAYLNTIAAAEDANHKKWYEYAPADNAAMAAMFTTFSTLKGLSSFGLARMLSDLNKSLQPIDASNTLAHNIRLAIAAGSDYVTVNDDAPYDVTMKTGYEQFPQELNIPEGSVGIAWNATAHEFQQSNSGIAAPSTYVYPAQLWYYVNSQIKTSNKSQKSLYTDPHDYDWNYILGQHTDAIAVNSRTRAVAIQKPIQYAVGLLELAVRVTDEDGDGKLEDNSDRIEGKKNVTVPTDGFPVSGILVGGQKSVGFDFTPKGSTEYTIFDKVLSNTMTAKIRTSDYSPVNHTLVLETAQGADVYVAVELTNNTGVDFYGADNQIVPAGGKFYVVAKLGASAATDAALVARLKTNQVFAQDFVTKANLSLKDLRKAYNTLPDLRTPQLELGFSVDLTWETGHTYDVDFDQ